MPSYLKFQNPNFITKPSPRNQGEDNTSETLTRQKKVNKRVLQLVRGWCNKLEEGSGVEGSVRHDTGGRRSVAATSQCETTEGQSKTTGEHASRNKCTSTIAEVGTYHQQASGRLRTTLRKKMHRTRTLSA